jgi:tetratricopeptide (TPR) repeat protein
MTLPNDPIPDSLLLPPSMTADDARTAPLAADMARRWRAGERVPAEQYLAQHPELWDQPEAAADLIYEEICLREEQGEEDAASQVLPRFPQWHAQLQVLLECHRMLEPELAAPRFPEAGQTWEGFRLLAVLGRGGQGRVFLATQPDLAGRPVVLKMTPCRGQEGQSLARLQHTHVVPLYAVHDDPARNLRALCMPYFGGLTLARLLQDLHGIPPDQRTGGDLVAALDRAEKAAAHPCPARGPARRQLARFTYVQAVCWLGACLADALTHAHERELLHLDLKPSNVLLAADGLPMLLDFHLAHKPVHPGGEPPEWLGGTPGYMAPEQAEAVAALCDGRPVPDPVDERADVYALGVVLYELLAGEVPSPGAPPLDRRNPAVCPGLAEVVARCLRRDPAERYPSALELGADLHRHLKDLALLGVREGALERWRKWRRRRPRALGHYAAAVILAAAVPVGVVAARAIREQLTESAKAVQLKTQEAEQARDMTLLAERARALHPLADRMRLLEEAGSLPADKAGELDRECQSVWDGREQIVQWVKKRATTLGEEEVQVDLLDLALLWSVLRAEQTPPADGRRDALRILDEAEELLGRRAALDRERQRHYAALGDTRAACAAERRAKELPAETSWDHTALGRSLFRAGNSARADEEFQRALAQQPQGLWPHFYAGLCAYRLGRPDDAVLDFTFCAALAASPRDMAPFLYNRAKAQAAAGRDALALRDYTQALQLDDTLGSAYLNRGVLNYRHRRYEAALRDLRAALDRGAPPAVVHYDEAVVYHGRGQDAEAVERLQAALKEDPQHKEARALLQALHGRAVRP